MTTDAWITRSVLVVTFGLLVGLPLTLATLVVTSVAIDLTMGL